MPTYVLAGTEDRNVRDIDGPRKFAAIQDRLGHDSVYVEFPNRGHEAFEQHYPEALEWLAARPRDPYPREVSRTPHSGIVPVSRRVHWLEVDARQGLAHARIEDAQRIEVTARWTRYITVYLHDRLVDLDRPVEIRINGKSMFSSRVQRSLPVALRQLRDLRDPARIYAAVVTLQVPQSEVSLAAARRLSDSIEPTIEEGRLSYWEFYATRALEERFPELGLSGEELSEVPGIALDGERVAIRITEVAPDGAFSGTGLSAGDLLLEVGGEPLFAGKGLDSLHHWLLRELVANERIYALVAWRDGAELRLQVPFALGPFRGPTFN